MNKRGMELTVSFFVILILSVVIFAGSLYFLRQFYTSTESFRQAIDQETESELQALIRDGNIVAIPLNKAKIAQGKGQSFWVGIQNVLDAEKPFGMTVAFSKAFTQNEEQILEADPTHINTNWVLFNAEPQLIKNGEFKALPVRIVVGTEIGSGMRTKQGTYAFNVCVWDASFSSSPPSDCGASSSYDLQNWYTSKIYKIFVEVP